MKKIVVALMITLISNSNNAFEDLQATTHTRQEKCNTFLDAATLIEESQDENNTLQLFDEYDQSISNHVTPPKVGKAEAVLKEAFGALLVRYISLREVARIYFKEIKDALTNWYHNTITT
jgi:hypothetical protein